MKDDKVRMYVELHPAAKRLIDADKRPNYEVVEKLAFDNLADQNTQVLKTQVDKMESVEEQLQNEVDARQEQLNDLRRDIREKRETIDDLQATDEERIQIMDSLLDTLADNPGHNLLAYQSPGRDSEKPLDRLQSRRKPMDVVYEELRERYAERDDIELGERQLTEKKPRNNR